MMNKISTLLILVYIIVFTQWLHAQDYKRTLKEDVYITSNADTIELHFSKKGKYKVFEGTSQNDFDWNSPIVSKGKKLTLLRKTARPYYAVVTSKKDTLIVAERKLIINDLDNFRDLGGIKTTEGRYVNWGRFYRSDALNVLLTSSFPYVEGLKINKVYDLRSAFEIATAKDNLPKNITYEHFPIFADDDSGMLQGLQQKLEKGALTQADAEELMMQTYKSFANDDAEKFNNLLHQVIIQDNHPNIFHCTAGKDRTGYTAAMILAILKVDKQTILDEYDMTNFYTEAKIKSYMANASQLGMGDKIGPEAIEAIMSVNKKYLEASFDIIDNKYGGIDAYIKNQLGFSDQERQNIINTFTYKR